MTRSRKYVLRQTLVLLFGEMVCVGAMWFGYMLLGKCSSSVILGGLVGVLVVTGNFLALATIATLAADRAEQQDVPGGEKLIRGSYPIRLLAMAAILVLCAKSGEVDVVALVLPLLFSRPVFTVAEFFDKKEE